MLSLGDYLTRQPPGRRYLAIHTGGHAMGVLLNFGTLSLLGPLIVRGVGGDPGGRACRGGRARATAIVGF